MSEIRKICFVIGTRPEAVKTWPAIEHFQTLPQFEVQTLLTGQHRELLDQMVSTLRIPVTLNLNVMREDQSLPELTASLTERMAGALEQLDPDCVIVQGDTTSVFVGALTAFYAGIRVGHIEAGLRSGDVRHPFPEEMNRRLVSSLANFHFAPTETAKRALLSENVPEDSIFLTGNTGIDALRLMSERLDSYPVAPGLSAALNGHGDRIIAVTIHRRENRPFMRGIAETLGKIIDHVKDARIVFPVHLSPAVRHAFGPVLAERERCHLLEPLDYPNFVRLLKASHLVLTDSGGVQEEAPYLGKPVLVIRRTTERPEAVDAGTARIIGEDPEAIAEATTTLLDDPAAYQSMARRVTPYGDGHAADRIADVLTRVL